MKTKNLLTLCALPFLQVSQAQEPGQRPKVIPRSGLELPTDPATVYEKADPRSFQLGVVIQRGPKLIVQAVMDDSPAKVAGLQVNDEILDLNGIKLSGFHALQTILAVAESQELKLTLKRGEEQLTVPVTPRKLIPRILMPSEPIAGTRAPQPPIRPSQSQPKVEQLLGEILSEMKKMNQREDQVRRAAPLPVPSVTQPTPQRQPRRRVVLPPKTK
ncbi:PDZ domain-containing protein [Verrucomicrobiaceae bacterium 227]